MSELLVVANRTVGGRAVLDRVREKTRAGDLHVRLVVPRTAPSSGLVIYDEAVRDAAQVRVDLAVRTLEEEGIDASGEVGDPNPFHATMDAIADRRPDEILVSTLPAASSGWLRRDLIERIQSASGIPVEHVVVDLATEDLPFRSTLVVANRTSSGDELVEHLRSKAAHGERHLFVVVVPLADGHGGAAAEARERLSHLTQKLAASGLLAAGMIADPDPYTATMNALELFSVDDVVISTLPAERSGWLREDLVQRVSRASRAPVEHVVVDLQETGSAPAAA
jgi:hypothetical protein